MADLTLASSTRRLACRIFDPIVTPENAIDVPVLPEIEGWLFEGLPVRREAALPSFSPFWLVYCKTRYNRYFADLPGGYETYMEKFGNIILYVPGATGYGCPRKKLAMSKFVLSAPHFNDEAYVEARVRANGRVCPHCGVFDRSGPLKEKTNRIGLYKCYACRKPFTVKIGTIFEGSHIQLRDWLVAMYLMSSSKKGIREDAYTNTVEGYFSILKRGIYGVYHHVSQRHLKRCFAEFDFRYNERIALGIDDIERTDRVIRGVTGKRLTYRTTHREIGDVS